VISEGTVTMNQSADKLIPPLERHAEADCELPASPLVIFEYIDRPERLSAHMERRSWRMGGGTMTIETDAAGGRPVGSRIRLAGRVLGMNLAVEGEVTERQPPYRKVWQTVGEPRLLVVGAYRMQVKIDKRGTGSHVRTPSIMHCHPSVYRGGSEYYSVRCTRAGA